MICCAGRLQPVECRGEEPAPQPQSTVGDWLSKLSWGNLTEEELREKFNEIDVDQSGKIDKHEITRALREVGKTEDEVRTLVDALSQETMDFDGFRNLVKPEPMLPSIFGWSDLTLEQMKAKFDELDTDRSGKLSKDEIMKGLRELGKSETDVQKEIGRLTKDDIDFEDFRLMAKPSRKPSPLHSVPGIGLFTAAFADAFFSMDEHELRDAFNKMDVNKSGFLEKNEIANVLREVGNTEDNVSKYVDSMADEDLDFEGFLELAGLKPSLHIAFKEWSDLPRSQFEEKVATLDACQNHVVRKADVVKVLQDLGTTEVEAQKLVKEASSVKDFSMSVGNATSDSDLSIRKLYDVVRLSMGKNHATKRKPKPAKDAALATPPASRTLKTNSAAAGSSNESFQQVRVGPRRRV